MFAIQNNHLWTNIINNSSRDVIWSEETGCLIFTEYIIFFILADDETEEDILWDY